MYKSKRYIISGNSNKGFRVVDTQSPGMPTLETFCRKWQAQSYLDDLILQDQNNTVLSKLDE